MQHVKIDASLLRRAREPDGAGLILFYNLLYADRGWVLPDHLAPVCQALADVRIKKLMLILGPGNGKALALDTKVLTRRGWIAMEEIKVGDQVMIPDGKTWVDVRGVFFQRPDFLYKITFKDGRVIRAHGNHLWSVQNKKFLSRQDGVLPWRIRNTQEIHDLLENAKGRGPKWYVPLCAPVEMGHRNFDIGPYTLGCILGDAHIGKNGSVFFTCFDDEIVSYIEEEKTRYPGGPAVSKRNRDGCYGLNGIQSAIKDLGINGHNADQKHIPEEYLEGSVEQRYAILQGLLDTDGTVSTTGSVYFTSVSKALAEAVRYLVKSLGGMASIGEKKAYYRKDGVCIEGKIAYTVGIRHPEPYKLFRMKRKLDRAKKTQYSDSLKLEISSIERESFMSPSVCINIDHPDGLFLIENYVVTHNSQLLSTTFPIWALGHDPSLTILGISGAENLMHGFIQGAMELIEYSPVYKAIFPAVRPDKNAGWSTQRGIFVTGRSPGIPDASFFGAGIGSKALAGKHAKLIILDDVHTDGNSQTPEQCEGVRRLYYNTILGRADPMGARFILAGRRWHENDLYGHLMQTEEWVTMILPAFRDGVKELYFDVLVPDGLKCVFTDN